MFGAIADVKVRLMRRRKVQRVVRLIDLQELVPAVERRAADRYLYVDFQFSIDPQSDDFLTRGVFSCYLPVEDGTPIPAGQKELRMDEWSDLFYLAHTDKKRPLTATLLTIFLPTGKSTGRITTSLRNTSTTIMRISTGGSLPSGGALK